MLHKCLVLFTLCTLGWCNSIQRRSGYPKFPSSLFSCGHRTTFWRPSRENSSSRQGRLVGGEETPLGGAPWVISLQDNNGLAHRCGAVLISNRILLTVAHCVQGNLSAFGGSIDLKENSLQTEQRVQILRTITHPDYRKLGVFSYDIAMLIMEEPGFEYTEFVKPICLTQQSAQPGTWCEVSGYGADRTKFKKLDLNLKSVSVPIMSLETCRKDEVYGPRSQRILDNMLCAGLLRGGVDACVGDSGGPLYCENNGRYELNGLVSWGEGCGRKNRPGVYTNVAEYLEWIKQVARENNLDF